MTQTRSAGALVARCNKCQSVEEQRRVGLFYQCASCGHTAELLSDLA